MRDLKNLPNLEPEEVARRKLGAQRLKERLSVIPRYAERAKRPGADEYFETLYGSCVNAPFRKLPGEESQPTSSKIDTTSDSKAGPILPIPEE